MGRAADGRSGGGRGEAGRRLGRVEMGVVGMV